MKAINSATTYLKEVRHELSQVVWPTRDQVVKLTAVVLIISAVVGLYVGALDYMFVRMMEYIISI